MTTPTLQIRRRLKILLLTEDSSRMSDNGGMLLPSDIPPDRLCRIFVGETLEGFYHETVCPEYRSIVQVCVEVMEHVAGGTGQIWCFGETSRERISRIAAWVGPVLHHRPSQNGTQFFIFPLDAAHLGPICPWPGLRNECSLHAFLVEDRSSSLGTLIQELYAATDVTSPSGNGIFTEIVNICYTRYRLLTPLQQASLTLLPGGPHSEFPCLTSTTYSVEDISSAFAKIADKYNCDFECIRNEHEEYLLFFRTGDSLVIAQ